MTSLFTETTEISGIRLKLLHFVGALLLKLPGIFFDVQECHMIIYFLIILGHAPKNGVGKAGNIMAGQTMPYTVRVVVALNEHHTCTFSRVCVVESEIL